LKLRSLVLSLYGHPDDLAIPFSFETRSLCNFVQRHARTLKIETVGFNQIVVHDDPFSVGEPRTKLVAEKSLSVPFRFDAGRYLRTDQQRKQEYFVEILRQGLLSANDFHRLPLEGLLQRVDDYVHTGYQNQWVHATKRIGAKGEIAELCCNLSMDNFTLTLRVHRKGAESMTLPVLVTKPDEICYHYQFKDLVLVEGDLVVTTRVPAGGELARFSLRTLLCAS
jgi:hypothetical protein